ncbi:MAG: acyltransferase family protein, partial [Clostridia bacterium]|nr:acyltransferase family protein [Clostridia bacterium]
MNEIKVNKRKNEISYLNILFCIIVIFIHACSEPMQQYQLNSLPYYLTLSLYRLSSFVVQGFIFLSGVKLFLNLKEPYDYVGAWLNQFKRIVLPYVLW